jgi:hypothetical protein
VLRDDDYDAFTITAGTALLLAPGSTFVLGRDSATLNGGAPVDYVYGSAFPLVEGADEINLYDASLTPVDRVAWTPTSPISLRRGEKTLVSRDTGREGGGPATWERRSSDWGF